MRLFSWVWNEVNICYCMSLIFVMFLASDPRVLQGWADLTNLKFQRTFIDLTFLRKLKCTVINLIHTRQKNKTILLFALEKICIVFFCFCFVVFVWLLFFLLFFLFFLQNSVEYKMWQNLFSKKKIKRRSYIQKHEAQFASHTSHWLY